MGVNNDNPCPICGSVYSDYEGDSYFRCRECQNLYNNAIGKWEMYGKVKITYSNGTGTKPEPDCINPDCVGGWMAEHEDLTELTIPCSRCNADRHKAKPFFAPKVIVHPRQPEPEQDEIIIEFSDEQAELKKYYRMLHSHEAVVYYSGYKHGYTSHNAEIEALKAEIESMKCCGNCDNLRATPQDHDFCWNNNGNLPSERICKYWTRKTK